MGVYTALLSLAAFVGALCAGFILAQAPRQRATQLAALLAASASWWALCEARWNSSADPEIALLWMRLSTPGWAFLSGLVPHLMGRYLDLYPSAESNRRRRLMRAATFGYAVGGVILLLAVSGHAVFGEMFRVPWGWNYVPGPAQRAYFLLIGPPLMLGVTVMLQTFRSPVAVATRSHRIAIRLAIVIPLVLAPVTEIVLPLAGIPFPRLGSTSYVLCWLVAVGTGLRYGISFFTAKEFSEEILDTLQEGVAMITLRGTIRRANRGLARMRGCKPEGLIGTELRDILSWAPPAEPRAVEEERAELRSIEAIPIPVSVSATPLHDQRGNTLGVVVVLRDLREIEDLQRRILTQARLAAVGELAAGLAHEINNPLAFVRSNLAQLERSWKMLSEQGDLPEEERGAIADEGRDLIGESLTGVDRAAEIVRGVRHFTHAGPPAREQADLNELLEDAISMLRPRLQPSQQNLELQAGAIPSISCAPQELRQVFLNLLVNALDAVEERGRVTVSTAQLDDWIVAEVRDDGCGMPPEVLARIFDPFFTTKRVGEGTGLGLGIAWHIVEKHGGRIDVESSPGSGTSFRVHLPLDAARIQPA